MVQTCGRGLSVLGGGKVGVGCCDDSGFAVWTDATIEMRVSYSDCAVMCMHSLLLLVPLLPESSLGVRAVVAMFVFSACEAIVQVQSRPRRSTTQRQYRWRRFYHHQLV